MPKKNIIITINNKKIKCREGQTIKEVAEKNGIFIPGLCSHPDFPPKANCRICLVEIEGSKKLVPSCSTKVSDGMVVNTESERVARIRNLNIELIFAEHIEKCPTCIWRFNCPLLKLAIKYKVQIKRFPDRKGKRKIYKFANAVEIDGTQCIDCRNCIDACSVLQNIHYLELKGKGSRQEVVPTKNKNIQCIYCGQCALHCPVSAAQEQAHWPEVEKLLRSKKKIMVAQFAPAIRVSIGEEFGIPHGTVVTEQLVGSLRRLGFDYVFDVNFGADITTIIEAEELIDRIKNGGVLPMFTSCCPAWVRYLEVYQPNLLPHLTKTRSPHIINGGIIKTYWAAKMKIKPKDIVVVSIMPCTAKKFEITRPELKVKGLRAVDYSLTTREFALMLKKNNINLAQVEKSQANNPMGEHSGAAAIYGASGGVMESALRTAQVILGEKTKKIEFKVVRGLKDVKEATIKIGGQDIRSVVVNGIGHIKKVLDNLDEYDYIEVMSCPGGCIGGGGQPIPTTPEIRKKRMMALYKIDKNKKVRYAHENQEAKEIISWIKKNKMKKILET